MSSSCLGCRQAIADNNNIDDSVETEFVIAVVGVPNSGKTTVFNALTGMRYKVANYPGVTVEKKAGKFVLPGGELATLIDLPGAYSLFGGSPDERVASDYLLRLIPGERDPDLLICVIDACNLERNLFFLSQLMDLGLPIVIALNFELTAKKQGFLIRQELLSRLLGLVIVDISVLNNYNFSMLKAEISRVLLKSKDRPKPFLWCKDQNFLAAISRIGSVELNQNDINDPRSAVWGLRIIKSPEYRHAELKTAEVREEVIIGLNQLGIDALSFETETRYNWVDDLVLRCVSFEDKLESGNRLRVDGIVTHRFWGTVIFALIMSLMFQSVFAWATLPMEFISSFFSWLKELAESFLPPGDLRSFVADGVITGIGSVLVFIPQIALLHLFIALLEESGYMARAAFLMDRLMRRIGLQGRSFVPFLSSVSCAVPGIMSARTISSWSDRLATIMAAPMICCSARLPVYTLLIAAFVPAGWFGGVISVQGFVLLGMYILGILGAGFTAILFKRTLLKGGPTTEFVMEMPPYRLPRLSTVFSSVFDRLVVFIRSVGTVVLLCSLLIWLFATYPKTPGLDPAQALEQSYIGQFGAFIQPIMEPLGFDWHITVSLVSSFASRELFVSSMALLHNIEGADISGEALSETLRKVINPVTGLPLYNTLTAITLLVFFAFSCQCVSTIAVCKQETGHWKWPLIMFLYMTSLAYLASLLVYRVGLMLMV